MTQQESQIVSLYEKLNYDISLIAEECGFGALEIKAVLAQYSVKYRADCKAGSNEDFNIDEQQEAKNAMVEILRCTEDENLKFRAAKFIRNDAKGRYDFAKSLQGINLNIFAFNERLNRMRLAKELTYTADNSSNGEVINVDAETKE